VLKNSGTKKSSKADQKTSKNNIASQTLLSDVYFLFDMLIPKRTHDKP
jgi:hypothetical protein